MALLQPDARLIVAETKRKCRLGLITRDSENRFWGLTAGHVLEDLATARLMNAAGEVIGQYSKADNQFGFGEDDAVGQIVRIELAKAAISPDKVNFGVTWPRSAIEEGTLLGTAIISVETSRRMIGTIVEIDSLAILGFRDAEEPRVVRGVIVVALHDPAIVKPGHAGTLLLSEAGEAVALAIATQTSGAGLELVGSPLRPYLEKTGLRPWAPSGAHWTDLSHRVRRFLHLARAHAGPDLGDAPQLGRG